MSLTQKNRIMITSKEEKRDQVKSRITEEKQNHPECLDGGNRGKPVRSVGLQTDARLRDMNSPATEAGAGEDSNEKKRTR